MHKFYKVLVLAFVIICGLQLFMLSRSIWVHEDIKRTGQVHLFEVRPRDPADPFRGRYMALKFSVEDSTFTNPPVELKRDLQKIRENYSSDFYVYVTFVTNAAGMAQVSRIYKEPPKETSDYLPVKWWDSLNHTNTNVTEIEFTMPVDRYYMSEKVADAADRRVRKEMMSTNTRPYLSVRIKNGVAVPEELYVRGLTLGEFLKTPE